MGGGGVELLKQKCVAAADTVVELGKEGANWGTSGWRGQTGELVDGGGKLGS